MDRRGLLVRTGAAALATLVGYSGTDVNGPRQRRGAPEGGGGTASARSTSTATPTQTATPASIVVPGIDWTEGDDSNLVVVLTVRNNREAAATAPVTVTVTVDGEAHERTREVTLDAGASTEVRFSFAVPYEARAAESFGIDVSVGE